MTPHERAEFVAGFDARHDPAQVRDLGYALLDVGAALSRYRWSADRMQRAPMDALALTEFSGAQVRVVETVERWNRELAEFNRARTERGAA